MSAASSSRGFVLIVVLWMLAALAALASAYSLFAVNTAASVYLPQERLGVEQAIRSAAELTAYRQLSWQKQSRPTQGRFSARLGAARLDVAFRAETARIDINGAPKALLAGAFFMAGASDANAKFIADRIVAWRSRGDDQARLQETAIYRKAKLSYGPVGTPFDNVLELAMLPQMTPGLLKRALPLLTIHNGTGKIDPTLADPAVLAAVPGMTKSIQSALRAAAAKRPLDDDAISQIAGPTKEFVAITPSDSLRVDILITYPNRQVTAQLVLLITDSAMEPYQILFWRDDFDGGPEG